MKGREASRRIPLSKVGLLYGGAAQDDLASRARGARVSTASLPLWLSTPHYPFAEARPHQTQGILSVMKLQSKATERLTSARQARTAPTLQHEEEQEEEGKQACGRQGLL
eukprot:1148812-Pelagomonas_calceolata.AAC.4